MIVEDLGLTTKTTFIMPLLADRCFEDLRPTKSNGKFNAFQKRKRTYIHTPKQSIQSIQPIKDTPIKQPYYSLMTLEDYPPYIALGTPLRLHGPDPKPVHKCICGRYIVHNMCLCASSSIHMDKYKWAKEHPDLYLLEQTKEKQWDIIRQYWYREYSTVAHKWHNISKHIIQHFTRLQDSESSIDCHQCDTNGHLYCKCCCQNCDSKWCEGNCMDNEDMY